MAVFVATGYLNLISQEGGYAGPDWELDKASLADMVAQHFGIECIRHDDDWFDKPYVPGDRPVGQARITIEKLEPKGEQ